ncbi:hypothetical protein [Corynebacterium tapiri]|uniref:Primosomal protein n=1 Tax=Corynebacterium tapiri TaxID=1448266 RepID=A0A5C4U5N6_9CORY|nr:hypothetical protein [Corynebacterium tapiri]TNL98458.1 hypothetical protein FHE74_04460 [Corynebacterium tapiri]
MNKRAIVPVKLSLNQGDVYTLWAPPWRENGAEWQAFLGDDTTILGFHDPEDLLLYIETHERHDLSSHPEWNRFHAQPAHRVVPRERDHYDLVTTPEALAGRASYENVSRVAGDFELTEALANVGGADTATIFFASNSVTRGVHRGADHFADSKDQAEWNAIGHAVANNWAAVMESINEVVRVPDLQFSEERKHDAHDRIAQATAQAEAARAEAEERRAAEAENADPYDSSAWAAAGIDPIKISLQGKTVYSLRTYVDSSPVFLGSYGEIFTFPSAKQLGRWMVENNDHDLARVSTWSDLSTLANAGELEVQVHPDNAYSFNGIAEVIAAGPEAVDSEQMNRAYELMADAADWAGDDSLNSYLLANPRFQDYLSYMLGSSESAGYVPSRPFDDKANSWRELEDMLTKRFSKF